MPHQAHGLCRNCYQRDWRLKHPERLDYYRKRHRDNYDRWCELRAPGRFKMRIAKRELKSEKESVINISGGKCVKCLSESSLTIYEAASESGDSRLIALCHKCRTDQREFEAFEKRLHTKCKRGHRYIEHGTYRTYPNSTGWICRECAKLNSKRHRRKHETVAAGREFD